MKRSLVFLVLIPLLISGCGPILGQLMAMGEGLRSFEVLSGQPPQVKSGETVLVFGPLAKGKDAFYICRGEDAAKFSDEFNRLGLRSTLYLGYGPQQVTLADAKKMSPEELRAALKLAAAPDYLLSGTLAQREMTVAPSHGVIMEESYELEILDLRTQAVSRYRASVKDLAQETIPDVAEALVQRLGHPLKK